MNLESTNPFYTQHIPSRNQGIFNDYGNKYRFDFSLATGDNVPGGTTEMASDLYYVFTVRASETVEGDVQNRKKCWIKKTLLETISEAGYFSIYKYAPPNSDVLGIFYGGQSKTSQQLIGLITVPLLGINGLWGSDSISLNTGLADVWTETSLTTLNTERNSYLSNGGIEKMAILYEGYIDTTTDSVKNVFREENLLFSNTIIGVNKPYTFVITKTDETVTGVYLGLPAQEFSIFDSGLSIQLMTETTTNDTFDLVPYENSNVNTGLISNFEPTNSVLSEGADSTQYTYLMLNASDEIIDSIPVSLLSNSSHKLSTNLLTYLEVGETLTVYIEFPNELDSGIVTSGTISTSKTGLPGSGHIMQLCVITRTVTNEFVLSGENPYFYELTSNGIKLLVPDNLGGGGDGAPADPDDFEEGLVDESGTANIDLNDEAHQENVKLSVRVNNLESNEVPLPANFINARYFDKGQAGSGDPSTLGVVRLDESDATNPLKVGLAGVDAIPTTGTGNAKVYGYGSNDKWGLFEFEDVKVVSPAEGEPYYTFDRDVSAAKEFGSTSETDFAPGSAYDPQSPDTGKDGVSITLSLGQFYDHEAAEPVLKDYRITLTWPNAIAPKISAVTAVTIDTPPSGLPVATAANLALTTDIYHNPVWREPVILQNI